MCLDTSWCVELMCWLNTANVFNARIKRNLEHCAGKCVDQNGFKSSRQIKNIKIAHRHSEAHLCSMHFWTWSDPTLWQCMVRWIKLVIWVRGKRSSMWTQAVWTSLGNRTTNLNEGFSTLSQKFLTKPNTCCKGIIIVMNSVCRIDLFFWIFFL